MSAPEPVQTGEDQRAVYEQLEKYPWEDDVEFQSGLVAILGSNSTAEQATELTLRARCFFYSRKYNINIDFDGYKAYRDAQPTTAPVSPPTFNDTYQSDTPADASPLLSTPSNPSETAAPYPTSFAHIVELISTGQPIPGIKDIPDTVLTGQGTAPSKPKRRKPWEKDEQPAAVVGDEAQQT